ncbi:MAG: ABC transporter ATP-binding protein [Rhodospirillales bacterium]|nr:ABC transporter ATP-binding protein [Rhodospirillales bacterium]
MRLDIDSVTWRAAGRTILNSVSLTAAPGEFVGLVGPNGSGKTSLLRCVYRVHRPHAGTVKLDGQDVWTLSAREAARRVAVVLQEPGADPGYSVREAVALGRTPHKGLLDPDTSDDHARVADALARVGLTALADRPLATLSGGERQRAVIARAIAQAPRVLVLDEPTNHLDIRHQIDSMLLVRSLGVTALASIHDLNLAAAVCDRIYVLAAGQVAAAGAPADVLTAETIHHVWGVDAEVVVDPRARRPRIDYTYDRPGLARPDLGA